MAGDAWPQATCSERISFPSISLKASRPFHFSGIDLGRAGNGKNQAAHGFVDYLKQIYRETESECSLKAKGGHRKAAFGDHRPAFSL